LSDPNDHSTSETPSGYGGAAGQHQFHTTHWSVVLLAGQESPQAATALEKLCRGYWYPLYAHARRQGHGPADAQDLTQQFFAMFLEKKYFGLANPDRGRFRSFLLASFKHFLTNEYHRVRAAKRGGAYAFVSWDEEDGEALYRNEPTIAISPDASFDQSWAITLLQKVMRDLQADYARADKAKLFEALQVYLSSARTDSTYEDVGAGLNMGESAVKMAVSRLRRRYGEMLRSEIANTVTEPAAVEDELRHLFQAVSH
jgi:RNA polymerase sigma-70 factor (ECF subfamily)